ncbi:MAG TPA: YbhB/YbcL family Raf kinase inhibitor-like protein [Caulobacteraceae bacterium]|nr:YbhB/YbcL family Raf kinase inhibitor-like protein [Caulobacteraceae bacterium]
MRMRLLSFAGVLAASALFATVAGSSCAAMQITSPDLKAGAPMPMANVYPRCGGRNISPALAWSGGPPGTKSLVLTIIDLTPPPHQWSHWIVVGLPPSATGLARGVRTLPAGAHAVAGNFGDAAYDGPCPPQGSGVHRYQITIWALPAAAPQIAPNGRADALGAMLAHTAIDHASLTVTAQR